MKDASTIDTHYLKLSGKGNIERGLEIGFNYELRAQGTITTKTESDNSDGSHSHYYRFEPVIIEIVTDKGESIRAKDPRSLSQIFRAKSWKCWHNNPCGLTFEQYYDRLMTNIVQNSQEVNEMYGPLDDKR